MVSARLERLTAVLLLLLMFGLAVHSLTEKAPTFDEQGYITRGLGYLRGENRHMRIGHPLGLNALNALFLVGDENVRLPTEHPSWSETSFHRPSELFMWEIGNDVPYVIFLARLPTVFLGLLLAALVGRWVGERRGRPFALFALAFIALDPNILAHTRLTTTDLGLAFGATLAGYTLWRYLARPTWGRAAVTAVAFAILQNTKFTAGLFVPLFALLIGLSFLLYWRQSERPLLAAARTYLLPLIVVYPLLSFFTLWAMYGFQIGTLPPNLPTLSQLSGQTLPLAHHLEQLLDIGGRVQKSTPAFLMGEYSDDGWWYYFPITFLLKTPLPTLLLILGGAVAWFLNLGRRNWSALVADLACLIPALGYLAIALTSTINLGYRHLLPMIPFLVVFGVSNWPLTLKQLWPVTDKVADKQPQGSEAGLRQWLVEDQGWWRWELLLLSGWLLVNTLFIAPHFLAFFNGLAGGPDNGWRLLVDSNIDWGQDLNRLADWQREQGERPIWLSYFGEARPDYYGIDYRGLASNPPRLMNPQARPFYPDKPAPGIYAISATNLQGVHFDDHDHFAWFREREPSAKIGYSIFLYEVPASGPPVGLALAGPQLDQLPPDDYARLGSNDVRPRWFDPAQALVVMAEPERWLVLGSDAAFHPLLIEEVDYFYEQQTDGLWYRGLRGPEVSAYERLTLYQGAGAVDFLGVDLTSEVVAAGEQLDLLTQWHQGADPQPFKIFIHLTDSEDNLVTQWDGLGLVWKGWRNGDTLRQVHTLTIPAEAAPGTYTLWAGLYHPVTLERWTYEAGDRLLLRTITIE